MTWGEISRTQVYMKEETKQESRYCLDSQAEKAKLESKARLCFKTPNAICSNFLIAAQTICIGVLPLFFKRLANS
jgi:hypothetical protein